MILFPVFNRSAPSSSAPVPGEPPLSGNEFTESFFTQVSSPWVDQGVGAHGVAVNPNGGNAYKFQWEIGDQFAQQNGVTSTTQTIRRSLTTARDTLDYTFYAWADSSYVTTDGDHLLYIKINTADEFDAPGTGFTFYVEPFGNGQYQVQCRKTLAGGKGGNLFEGALTTTGAPNFNSDIPRKIRCVMQMNDLGSANGVMQLYVDDVLYLDESDYTYRTVAGDQFKQFIIGPYAQGVQTAQSSMYFDNFEVSSNDSVSSDFIPRTHTAFANAEFGNGRVSVLFDFSERTSLGDLEFDVSRDFGTNGIVTVDYTSGGDAHSVVTGTLTWAAGDASVKRVTVPIASKLPGEGRYHLQLSNPTGGLVLHHAGFTRAYGVIDDNTIAVDSRAVFFNTALGSSGNGTQNSPFNNVYEAITLANTSNNYRFVYGRGVIVPDGTNNGEPYGKSGIFSIDAPAARPSPETSITVRNWPGFTLGVDGNGQTNVSGFFSPFNANRSNQTYKNISFTNLNANGISGSPGFAIWHHYGDYDGITVEHCQFDGIDGDENNGGVNVYGTLGAKIWGCTFANIMKNGDPTNGNTGGVYSYKGENISTQRCTFESTMSKCCFQKGTELGEVAMSMRWNIIRGCQIDYGQQGGGDPGHFGMLVTHNLWIGNKAYIYHRALALVVGTGRNVFADNYFRTSGENVRGCIEAAFAEDLQIYNNIVDNGNYLMSDQSSSTADIPTFMDNNVIFNLRGNYTALDFASRTKAATNTFTGENYGANDLDEDPNPTNPGAEDYTPQNANVATAGIGGGVAGPYTTGLEPGLPS